MSMDEIDRLLSEAPAQGPLHDAMRAHQTPSEDEVERIARRVEARLSPSTTRWVRGLVVAGLAAAAALAVWASRSEPPLAPSWTIPPVPVAAERLRPSPSTLEPGVEAANWLAEGRVDDAVLRYQLLLAEQPTDPRAAGWQRGLVQALRTRGDHSASLEAAFHLLERYGPGTPWAERYGSETERTATAKTLVKSAVAAHAAGRKAKNLALLDQAAVAYELYFHDLAEPEGSPEVRYGYAELLYERERFDEAWEQYNTVVEHDADPARARFCAESAVFAAEEMLKVAKDDGVWRDRFVATLDAYVSRWPDDKKSVAMGYKAAYAVYERDPTAGGERFETIAQDFPGTREGGFAANLAVDAYILEEDFQGAADWVAHWLTLEGTDPETREELARIGANAAYEATRRALLKGADPEVVWAEYYEEWPNGPQPKARDEQDP
ncbi:MAG: hypothetical protein AAGA48_30085 [Myxococcota bacterium]